MIYSAIVALNTAIADQIDRPDDDIDLSVQFIRELPQGMQGAVNSRQRNGMQDSVVIGVDSYNVYLVYGTAEALELAQETWGDNLIIGDTWTKGDRNTPACRAGFKYITQEAAESTPENPVFEKVRVGQEIRPRHPDLLSWLAPIPDTYDQDGNVLTWKQPTDFSHLNRIHGHGEREM